MKYIVHVISMGAVLGVLMLPHGIFAQTEGGNKKIDAQCAQQSKKREAAAQCKNITNTQAREACEQKTRVRPIEGISKDGKVRSACFSEKTIEKLFGKECLSSCKDGIEFERGGGGSSFCKSDPVSGVTARCRNEEKSNTTSENGVLSNAEKVAQAQLKNMNSAADEIQQFTNQENKDPGEPIRSTQSKLAELLRELKTGEVKDVQDVSKVLDVFPSGSKTGFETELPAGVAPLPSDVASFTPEVVSDRDGTFRPAKNDFEARADLLEGGAHVTNTSLFSGPVYQPPVGVLPDGSVLSGINARVGDTQFVYTRQTGDLIEVYSRPVGESGRTPRYAGYYFLSSSFGNGAGSAYILDQYRQNSL